ncbi:hypothetical protein CCHR01_18640 [Colletotrichum chrysophilum]|uniref:Uncharacterized protein n=1 Tax=Colletotrichum chrysophilum TaxID=1836956 RepID=A0AAD9E8Q3_9PEZI|nr:hypothetical protein CCHR01_18640 [Colletotrichum chrysophilum]
MIPTVSYIASRSTSSNEGWTTGSANQQTAANECGNGCRRRGKVTQIFTSKEQSWRAAILLVLAFMTLYRYFWGLAGAVRIERVKVEIVVTQMALPDKGRRRVCLGNRCLFGSHGWHHFISSKPSRKCGWMTLDTPGNRGFVCSSASGGKAHRKARHASFQRTLITLPRSSLPSPGLRGRGRDGVSEKAGADGSPRPSHQHFDQCTIYVRRQLPALFRLASVSSPALYLAIRWPLIRPGLAEPTSHAVVGSAWAFRVGSEAVVSFIIQYPSRSPLQSKGKACKLRAGKRARTKPKAGVSVGYSAPSTTGTIAGHVIKQQHPWLMISHFLRHSAQDIAHIHNLAGWLGRGPRTGLSGQHGLAGLQCKEALRGWRPCTKEEASEANFSTSMSVWSLRISIPARSTIASGVGAWSKLYAVAFAFVCRPAGASWARATG